MKKFKEAGDDFIVACLMQAISVMYFLNSFILFLSGVGVIIKNLILKLRN